MKLGARVKYDLYLSPQVDGRLIDHLEPFVQARRLQEELRRMLYLALDGAAVAVTKIPAMGSRSEASVTKFEVVPVADGDNKKAIARSMFGKPSL